MQPPKIWREKRQRYLAIGMKCKKCGHKSFPLVMACPACGSNEIEEYKLQKQGELLQFTLVSQASHEMINFSPYVYGLIELEDGVKISGQIVDCKYSELKEGTKVRMIFRVLSRDNDEGLIKYGYKFTPI
ncbi:MAG: Zn-ribbon domain-containing OB-fold protein [Candidatus Heimdallarchaeaceae archaeon]